MSTRSLCLNEIHQSIPDEILEEAFVIPYRRDYYRPVSVDAMILDKVWDARIMPDLNIEYSKKIEVPLSACGIEQVNISDFIVTVPPDATGGRKIITVLGINTAGLFGATSLPNTLGSFTNSSILQAAQTMANTNSVVEPNYLERCDMISPNSFYVRRAPYLNGNCLIELVIENDSRLNDVPLKSIKHFKKLTVLATKAFIYRTLKIRVNQAKLDGGSELGAFSEFIDSYADADEQYKEELTYMSRIGWLADNEQKWDYMRMIMKPV